MLTQELINYYMSRDCSHWSDDTKHLFSSVIINPTDFTSRLAFWDTILESWESTPEEKSAAQAGVRMVEKGRLTVEDLGKELHQESIMALYDFWKCSNYTDKIRFRDSFRLGSFEELEDFFSPSTGVVTKRNHLGGNFVDFMKSDKVKRQYNYGWFNFPEEIDAFVYYSLSQMNDEAPYGSIATRIPRFNVFDYGWPIIGSHKVCLLHPNFMIDHRIKRLAMICPAAGAKDWISNWCERTIARLQSGHQIIFDAYSSQEKNFRDLICEGGIHATNVCRNKRGLPLLEQHHEQEFTAWFDSHWDSCY